MANSLYKNSLKAGIVAVIFLFIGISYVNSSNAERNKYQNKTYQYGFLKAHEPSDEPALNPRNNARVFLVTAYLPIDEYENRFHGITYTGVPARPYHTIAVDPEIVPLGSIVFIEGLGSWKAEDTGNMIKGKRLDICVSSRDEAMRWGKRARKVWYIPPEQLVKNSAEDNSEMVVAELSKAD